MQGTERNFAGTDLATLAKLREKYGDGRVVVAKGSNERADIMWELVYPTLDDESWEYCTIGAWLNGNPSEDDISWWQEEVSGVPTLETVCGDHSFFNQYDEAFNTFAKKGAPKEVIDWLRQKGSGAQAVKKKMVEQQTEENVEKMKEEAKKRAKDLNPVSNPFVIAGIAAAVVLILYMKSK